MAIDGGGGPGGGGGRTTSGPTPNLMNAGKNCPAGRTPVGLLFPDLRVGRPSSIFRRGRLKQGQAQRRPGCSAANASAVVRRRITDEVKGVRAAGVGFAEHLSTSVSRLQPAGAHRPRRVPSLSRRHGRPLPGLQSARRTPAGRGAGPREEGWPESVPWEQSTPGATPSAEVLGQLAWQRRTVDCLRSNRSTGAAAANVRPSSRWTRAGRTAHRRVAGGAKTGSEYSGRSPVGSVGSDPPRLG